MTFLHILIYYSYVHTIDNAFFNIGILMDQFWIRLYFYEYFGDIADIRMHIIYVCYIIVVCRVCTRFARMERKSYNNNKSVSV